MVNKTAIGFILGGSATFLFGAGLEIADYKNQKLGIGLMVVGGIIGVAQTAALMRKPTPTKTDAKARKLSDAMLKYDLDKRKDAVISELVSHRRTLETLSEKCRTYYAPASKDPVLEAVHGAYLYILKNVSVTEAELFRDLTNLQLPALKADANNNQEQEAVLRDLGHYVKRLTELLDRVKTRSALS